MSLLKNINNNQDYRSHSALNQSYLKTLTNGFKEKKELDEDDLKYKLHFELGSVLDYMMNPHVDFRNYYLVEDINTEHSLYPVAAFLASRNNVSWKSISEEEKLFALEQTETYVKTNWSNETKIKKLEEISEIYETLVRVNEENKKVISISTYDRVCRMKESIINNPYYLELVTTIDEAYYQVFLTSAFSGLELKGLIDMIFVNNKQKIIYLIDLKTTPTYYGFPKSVLKFRYDIQMAYYYDLLVDNLSDEYKDYEVKVKFLVVETTEPHIACWYNVSNKIIDMGRYGSIVNGTVYKGYVRLLDDYKYYSNCNFNCLPKDIVNANGQLDLNYW